MTISMYQASAPVFAQGLRGLGLVLTKAEAHVAARNIDPAALLQARLYPDMFPLIRQVQIAADFAKGCVARLGGAEVPAWADDETGFADLRTRVERTSAFIAGFAADQIDGSEDREIALTRRGVTTVVQGQTYLLMQALPNFYFHAATAYDILRHNGVEIGKADYMGMV